MVFVCSIASQVRYLLFFVASLQTICAIEDFAPPKSLAELQDHLTRLDGTNAFTIVGQLPNTTLGPDQGSCTSAVRPQRFPLLMCIHLIIGNRKVRPLGQSASKRRLLPCNSGI